MAMPLLPFMFTSNIPVCCTMCVSSLCGQLPPCQPVHVRMWAEAPRNQHHLWPRLCLTKDFYIVSLLSNSPAPITIPVGLWLINGQSIRTCWENLVPLQVARRAQNRVHQPSLLQRRRWCRRRLRLLGGWPPSDNI